MCAGALLFFSHAAARTAALAHLNTNSLISGRAGWLQVHQHRRDCPQPHWPSSIRELFGWGSCPVLAHARGQGHDMLLSSPSIDFFLSQLLSWLLLCNCSPVRDVMQCQWTATCSSLSSICCLSWLLGAFLSSSVTTCLKVTCSKGVSATNGVVGLLTTQVCSVLECCCPTTCSFMISFLSELDDLLGKLRKAVHTKSPDLDTVLLLQVPGSFPVHSRDD